MFRKIMFAAVMLIASFPAFAFEIPQSQGKVTDTANVLSATEKRVLTQRLEQIQKTNPDHPQIGILTVSSLPEEGIEEFANQVFHSWGIGQKGVDNGLLLVVAPNNRKMRLEVGYGFEPYIPDATARKIIDNMKPYLRKNQWYVAFDGAVTDMVNYLPSKQTVAEIPLPPPTAAPVKVFEQPTTVTKKPVDNSGHPVLFILLAVGVGLFVIVMVIRTMAESDRERDREEEAIARRRRELNDLVSKKPTYTSSVNSYKYKPVHKSPSSFGSGLVTGVAATEAAESLARRHREEQREEEERRSRRRREEESSSSSSSWGSSSSSSDSGSSWGSSSSSSDSGSSWGGGDSGGGGASGDW